MERKWMDFDDTTQRALFRLEVIGPLLGGHVSKAEAARIRRSILETTYVAPNGTTWRISRRTLAYWLRRYEEHGFAGLHDRNPGTYGVSRAIPEVVLRAAVRLRDIESRLSVRQILALLPYTEELTGKEIDVDEIAPSTLNRQLNRRGAKKGRKDERDGTYGRREEKFVNDVWQADTSDGPWLPDPTCPSKLRKTYLISFIDDASRCVMFAQFYFDTQLTSLLDCFKKALLTRGQPVRTYWDNAWVFHSTTMTLLCAELGIRPSFSKKGKPPGRGKVERHIRTVQDGFQLIAEHADLKTLDELNQFFFAWLDAGYHEVEHKELGMTPLVRWEMDKDRIERVPPGKLRRGLMLRCRRTVDRKTAQVRLDNVRYQASANLAGEKVEVRYHFDDASEIELWQRGKQIETAKPVVVQPNIDFSRLLARKESKEKKRGVPYAEFKGYRAKLVGERKPSAPTLPRASDYLYEGEWVELVAEQLARRLSEGEDEYLRKFFFQHAPLAKQSTKELLSKLVDVCGREQHVGSYCQRLLEALTNGGKA
jgi:transposase InsO family protein